ncbi:cobalamin-dependent protein [Rhizobium sp. SGZ-381]|uniref:MerR family transcriptional regulator n=1 Tax=Rhizobium sp. SGZ-381 TaxID=3342800 RepID=UPI0036700399
MAEALRHVGISKLVLHAWERRYQQPLAERTETGRRYFTADQVYRLILLKECSDAGYRIGTIISLPIESLAEIARAHHKLINLTPLLDAIRRMDAIAMKTLLEEHLAVETPAEFGKATVAPLMKEVGRQWSEGTLSIAAEHMVSAEIRGMLSICLNSLPLDPAAPKAIVATFEGEHHEIGALLATLLARNAGLAAVYLGPNLPIDDIVSAAEASSARVVCLSCLIGKARNLKPRLERLRQTLPVPIEIWTGGPGFSEAPVISGIRHFSEIGEFEKAAETLARGEKAPSRRHAARAD